MQTAQEKLTSDLTILEAMAAEMDTYLMQDALFWRMMGGGMPMLTLGGYLMRQHRLLALVDLLDDEEKGRLDTAVSQFNAALVEKVVYFEQKAITELDARLRQWSQYLSEAEWQDNSDYNHYPAAVETRAMLAALVDKLDERPYQLPPRILTHLAQLDTLLRAHWLPGSFIWPDGLQPAYPQDDYWWLYGRP
ncbi:MAG: hypothetical protein H6662_07630 [Ardenticatenaceae bacterium]|nr:hypothetical protein [Anaerolineales bacterium]MCB8921434.1 hypothetical protein [Ardenticatenaceae bacterium]MCB8991551.1 hypothetical protein [Ardenticatenaceae bacterium]MCB9005087.1 hypothetical protein [Ardenticatenaceae bacterium]